jgi:formylglycine-generating enzyme required for sulfatase activity
MADSQKLKVFISYSRKDSTDFADELVAGLELAGFAPFIDRHDIAAGEDWETRLGGLIQDADTVVYVISPEAVKSDRCAWEVDKSLALAKRLIPVIFKPVPEADIPQSLRRLQFIRFDQGLGITRPLAQLAEALRQDLDWIREHTRIGDLAARWEGRARPSSLLLRGDDLDAARAWVAKRKPDAPEITEAQTSLINASIADSRTARRRTQLLHAVMLALALCIVGGLIAWLNQSYLMERWHWFAIERPYMQTQFQSHTLTAEAEQALKPGDAIRECAKNCPEMIVVPAGEFMMGSIATEKGYSDDEGPLHRVHIASAFAVSKFEVTFDDWDACASVGPCGQRGTAVYAGFGRAAQPVIYVNWDDAHQYAAWLSRMTGKSYRLLTEAEWEYAARGGTTTAYSWGDEIGNKNANCNGCGSQWDGKEPAPVGSFTANAFGLHDMHGNVGEWVEDCYHDSYAEARKDGTAWLGGDCRFRVIRGGSWEDRPPFVRSAHRGGGTRIASDPSTGIRVARTLNR